MEINNNNVHNTAIGKNRKKWKIGEVWPLQWKYSQVWLRFQKIVCISTFWRFRCQRLVNDVSRDHFDAIEWIIYEDDRVVSYLVCLIYTSKWFHVAYNCNVRSKKVSIYLFQKVQNSRRFECKIYEETVSQLPIIRSCVPKHFTSTGDASYNRNGHINATHSTSDASEVI